MGGTRLQDYLSDLMSFQNAMVSLSGRRVCSFRSVFPQELHRVRRASGRPSSLAPQAHDKAFQSALIWPCTAVQRGPCASG